MLPQQLENQSYLAQEEKVSVQLKMRTNYTLLRLEKWNDKDHLCNKFLRSVDSSQQNHNNLSLSNGIHISRPICMMKCIKGLNTFSYEDQMHEGHTNRRYALSKSLS